jgi:hypothetical protein
MHFTEHLMNAFEKSLQKNDFDARSQHTRTKQYLMPGHRGVQQSGEHETLLSELKPWEVSPKKAPPDAV